MKKLLVSDYDGTFFVNSDLAKINVEAVKKFRKAGNLFAIATGNNYAHFLDVVRELGIEYDYLILDQGSVLVNKEGENLFNCYINEDIVSDICNALTKESDNLSLFDPYKQCENFQKNNITKISTRIKDLDKAKSVTKKILGMFGKDVNAYTMIFSETNIVEIISSKTDKKESIKRLAEIEKISEDNIYVIGDGYNDMTMIEAFNGYCMKSSVPELREVCSNQVSSVAELINTIEKL